MIRRLSQSGHAAETERDLKAGLNALQCENDAVGVLQRGHLGAADESAAGADARISAVDGAGARQLLAVPTRSTAETPRLPMPIPLTDSRYLWP